MALRTGDLLRGTRGVYEITHRLKNPSLFKARILCSSTTPANWALVKTAETSMQKLRLHSEHLKYKLPEIAASPYFPTLLDAIKSEKNPSEPSSLVFEHLSTNLQSISPADFRANGDLAKIVSKGVLSALETVNKGGSVHTAVNPDNIFVTFDGRYGAIAKLGDLGLFIMNGSAGRPSLNPTYRAPEVYFGEMCCHNSDVWSLGITLADQISPLRIFGRRDRLLEDQTEEQRDAELMHPVTPAGKAIDISTEEGKDEFWRHMMIDHDPLGFHDSIVKGRWRKGLEHLPGPPVPQDLLDFIEYLLVVDPKKRPTAADALKHPYLSRRRY